MNLEALAGNTQLKRQLSAQQRGRGLSHAYLIAGPAGSGKRTLAALLAQAMICSGQGEKPCGVCSGCKKAAAGIHPDIIHVELLKDKREITVDQARKLQADAYIRPNEAPRKVYIIHHAEAMNPQAQNAMLKLLEDGPAYAAFLLLTLNAGSILTTVRSRCETLSLAPLTPQQAEDYLRRRFPQAGTEAIYTAARRCGGALGSVIPQLEGGETTDETGQAAAELVSLLGQGDELALAQWCVGLEKWERAAFDQMLSRAVTLLRDALTVAAGGEPLTDGSRERAAVRAAAALPRARLVRCADLLETLISDSGYNVGVGHLAGALAAGANREVTP